MNKKFLIPLTILLTLLTLTLTQDRTFWVDESYSYLTATQYPFSWWFAAYPALFILSILLFYKCAQACEWDVIPRLRIAFYAILGVLAYTLSNTNPRDAHAMGYYFILHYWTLAFGTTTYAMRSLSAIFGIAALYALWVYCTKWHDEKTALTATTLLAISSTMLYYFTETRMYALLILLGILATHQLRLIIQENKKPTTYSIIIILMAHLHYFTAVMLLSHLIIMLTNKVNMNTIRKTIMPIILTCTPLILYFLQQKARITNMYLKPPTPLTWFSSIGFSLNYPDNLKAEANNTLLITAATLILALIIYAALKKDNKWTWTELALATTPQMIGIIIALFYFTYHPRYFLLLLWLVPVLIAQAIHTIPNKVIKATALILILSLTLGITLASTPNKEIQNCTSTMRLDSNTLNNITIIHETPFSSLPTRYYLRNDPRYTNLWLTNYTKPMRNSMNGDTTNTTNIIMLQEKLPPFNYYYEASHVLNTQNMTLLTECNGLRIWTTHPPS